MIRVVLADDHTVLRSKLALLLAQEPDVEVVGEASNGLLLLELLAETAADVVLLDVNMPAMNGLTATHAIRQQFPLVKVLVLSLLDHEYYIERMLAAGATGYILKNAPLTEIIHAVRVVSTGLPFLCTEIGMSLMHKLTHGHVLSKRSEANTKLSAREQQAFHLLVAGLSNKEIAVRLSTSTRLLRPTAGFASHQSR